MNVRYAAHCGLSLDDLSLPLSVSGRSFARCALRSKTWNLWRILAWEQPRAHDRQRGAEEIAQELIAAVTLDRGQVVRDQPVRPFDCDLDTALREIEHRDAATAVAAMRLRGGKGDGRYP